MIKWLNKQNKRHMYLYGQRDLLHQQDNVDWFEIALNQNPDALNKKVGKISPRRHKKFKKHKKHFSEPNNWVSEVIEMFDNDRTQYK